MDSLRRSTQLLNEDQEMSGALGNNVPPPPVALLEPTMAEVMTRMLDMYEMEEEEHATFTGKQLLPLPGLLKRQCSLAKSEARSSSKRVLGLFIHLRLVLRAPACLAIDRLNNLVAR
nr:hypothetical protein Itr_chr12CG16570 [Ipomoea trifida]